MLVSGMVASDTPSTLKTIEAKQDNVTLTNSETTLKVDVTATTKKADKNINAGVESRVREYFADIPLMAEISKCESHFRQLEADGSVFRGIVNNRDVGALQINEYYHKARSQKLGLDINTLEGNMKYARILYEEQGGQPWISSSPCWKKSTVAKGMSIPLKTSVATAAQVTPVVPVTPVATSSVAVAAAAITTTSAASTTVPATVILAENITK